MISIGVRRRLTEGASKLPLTFKPLQGNARRFCSSANRLGS
jgi:hypothetical protein